MEKDSNPVSLPDDKRPTTDFLRRSLLTWYRRSRRDLAWRHTTDPYLIWISEVMLQQTRVEAVQPYYLRFVGAFPTLDDLAEASLEEVLAVWSGLGYYRRARSLHAAVRECRERYAGQVPREPDAFLGLPGVGPYTQAAVMSIAHGEPMAVVDGNVIRVLARLYALAGGRKDPKLAKRVRQIAGELLADDAPGDFNQALMELGATVCTPKQPACGRCPWGERCRAYAEGRPERWPQPAPRTTPRDVVWNAALIERDDRVLLARRDDGGRLAGMWELPWTERTWRMVGKSYGLRLQRVAEVARIRHGILNERITVVVHRARLVDGAETARFEWAERAAIGDYGVSSVWKKVLAATG